MVTKKKQYCPPEDEGWLTDAVALETVYGLGGMKPGDEIWCNQCNVEHTITGVYAGAVYCGSDEMKLDIIAGWRRAK